jgi:Ca2+-binding EF-hand superfamily protein
VVDSSGASQKVMDEIVGAIVATFLKNKTPLSFAFRYFDPKGTGSVNKADFSAGLAALVATADVGSSPITRAQMDLFVNYMDTDGDGNIDYKEFLNMFAGKDAISHSGSFKLKPGGSFRVKK